LVARDGERGGAPAPTHEGARTERPARDLHPSGHTHVRRGAACRAIAGCRELHASIARPPARDSRLATSATPAKARSRPGFAVARLSRIDMHAWLSLR